MTREELERKKFEEMRLRFDDVETGDPARECWV
jgi:hypothetical protein